ASSPDALAAAESARCVVETYAAAKRGVREPMWHAEIVDGGAPARAQIHVRRAGDPFGRLDVALVGERTGVETMGAITCGGGRGGGGGRGRRSRWWAGGSAGSSAARSSSGSPRGCRCSTTTATTRRR